MTVQKLTARKRIIDFIREHPNCLLRAKEWHRFLRLTPWYSKEVKNLQASLRNLEVEGRLPRGLVIIRLGGEETRYGFINSDHTVAALKRL